MDSMASDQEVTNAALTYAARNGVQAGSNDCRVVPLETRIMTKDSGGEDMSIQPTQHWHVYIKGQRGGKPGCFLVAVQAPSGNAVATDFQELPSSQCQ
jgi:hypothetical protein